jgi:hypothetical protein
MSLDKSIASGKEHRKPYYHSGRFDKTCRPHGSCPYCRDNRLHKSKASEPVIEMDEIKKTAISDSLNLTPLS